MDGERIARLRSAASWGAAAEHQDLPARLLQPRGLQGGPAVLSGGVAAHTPRGVRPVQRPQAARRVLGFHRPGPRHRCAAARRRVAGAAGGRAQSLHTRGQAGLAARRVTGPEGRRACRIGGHPRGGCHDRLPPGPAAVPVAPPVPRARSLCRAAARLPGAPARPVRRSLPAAAEAAEGEPASCPPSEAMWLDGLCQDTAQAREARGTLEAYALHAAAAALRSAEVAADAARASQALEIFVLWLGDSLADGPDASPAEEEAAARSDDDEVVAAALGGEGVTGAPGDRSRCQRQHWLWLLFLSPFPAELVHSQPAVTLKFWKIVCGLLCKPGQSGRQSEMQLLHLALVVSRLCKELVPALDSSQAVSETEEKQILYPQFALLVPAVTSACTVLQGVCGGPAGRAAPRRGAGARAAARQCLGRVELALSRGLQHPSPKFGCVLLILLLAQSLLQSPACVVLCPVVLPALAAVFTAPGAGAAALDGAWGAVAAMLAAQQAAAGASFTGATTRMVMSVVLAVLGCSSHRPGSFDAHTAAMARCLVQVARTDARGVKAEVAAMTPERQATIQQLLRDHMSAAGAAGAGASSVAASAGPGAASKISLKLKF
ncbi:unnamed protein product [Prorocentrum cordatum]|uniref:Uncharacterized protein n=1 Tax=Prorocentrum cordatum TaxID=2364126 RepID=A0ABN9U9P1_9DINO|nr:unnamed protein product [Polarella glacialis]